MSRKTLSRWKPVLGLSLGQTGGGRMSTTGAVMKLGLAISGAAFTYGVARNSQDNLVKTAGYVTAGLLGLSVIGGVIMLAMK